MRISIAVILAVILLPAVVHADAPTKDQIDAAKKAAVAYLLSIQQNGRGWEPPGSSEPPYAATIEVLNALIAAGEDPAKNLKLQEPVKLVAEAVCPLGRSPSFFGSLRIRLLANPIFKNKYKSIVLSDFSAIAKNIKSTGWVEMGDPHGKDVYHFMPLTFSAWQAIYSEKTKIPESAWISLSDTLIKAQRHQNPPKETPGYGTPWNENGGWPRTNFPGYDGEGSVGGVKLLNSLESTSQAMILLSMAKGEIKVKAQKNAIGTSLKDGFDFLDRKYAHEMKISYGSLQIPGEFIDLAKMANHPKFGNDNIVDTAMSRAVHGIMDGNLQNARPGSVASYLMRLCN